MNFAVYLYSLVTMVTMLSRTLTNFLFKNKVVLYMHLDMIAVNFFRLIQFYDTLFALAILYRASGWGICTPIIWISLKICCRMVKNVTFPPEINALKSICIQFLVKYTTFCV